MKKIIFCLIVLVLLVGCVQQPADEDEAEGVPGAEEEETAPERVETQQVKSSNLGDDIKETIDEQLVPTVANVLPINYRKMKYGDSFVFGLGVQNVNTYDTRFLVTVEFNKAYDRYTNLIDVDEGTINSWIKTTYSPFELEQHGKKTISIALEVGNMEPGKSATPGTYVFDVVVNSGKLTDALLNDVHGQKRQLSIKVEK